jgi:uncharacterized membrane protein YkgB
MVWRAEVLSRPESGAEPGGTYNPHSDIRNGPASVSVPVLALWECAIGIGLITKPFMRATLLLLFVQMIGTITPIFLFPNEVFTVLPYAPTLEGQYIIKNIVLVSAGLVIGATVRGGRVVSNPEG